MKRKKLTQLSLFDFNTEANTADDVRYFEEEVSKRKLTYWKDTHPEHIKLPDIPVDWIKQYHVDASGDSKNLVASIIIPNHYTPDLNGIVVASYRFQAGNFGSLYQVFCDGKLIERYGPLSSSRNSRFHEVFRRLHHIALWSVTSPIKKIQP